jgi:hypothetical protein
LRAAIAATARSPSVAIDRRDVHPDLFEHPTAAHDAHQSAARVGPVVGLGAWSRTSKTASGRVAALAVFQCFESGHDFVPQGCGTTPRRAICGLRNGLSSNVFRCLGCVATYQTRPRQTTRSHRAAIAAARVANSGMDFRPRIA